MIEYSDLIRTQETTAGIISTAACALSERETVVYHLLEDKIKTVRAECTVLNTSYSIVLMKLTPGDGAFDVETARASEVTHCPAKANALFTLLVNNMVTPCTLEDVVNDWQEE